MALRITISETERAITLRLDGRLAGPWVQELSRAWSEVAPQRGDRNVIIDLREVTYSDPQGVDVLKQISARTGAEFLTSSPWTEHIAQQIQG